MGSARELPFDYDRRPGRRLQSDAVPVLVGALRRRPEFRVISCGVDMEVILNAIAEFPVDVILMNADHPKLAGQDMANVRRLHLAASAHRQGSGAG